MGDRCPFTPGQLVAAYFRDSGGDTQELSIPQQEASFRTWCAQNGLITGSIFTDAARPGSSVIAREGFQDMMHHFRSSPPEVGLLIWSYSRFARDFDDAQFYRADLRRRGFIFYSLNDEIPEGPMGRFFEAAIDWKNEQFLEDLSRDVRRGLHDLVARYGAVPGTPPRGFIRQPVEIAARRDGSTHTAHRWVPDPEKIPLVRQAFAMLLAGHSLAEIQQATHLYGSINSWTTFFTNELYKGTLIFGDLSIAGYCDPIIDPDTWALAQSVIAARARKKHLSGDNPQHPRRSGVVYLLSGLVYCARCGSPLSGSTEKATRPDGNEYRYQRYVCSRLKRSRDCNAEGIPRIFLEDLVTKTLLDTILTPDNLAAHHELLQQSETERQAELSAKLTALRSQLGNTRRRIANVTDALADEGKSRALLAKLSDLEAAEADLLSGITAITSQTQLVVKPTTPAQLQALTARLDKPDRRLLRALIHRITADRDGDIVRLQFDYYYPPEDHPPPSDETMSMTRAPVGALSHRYTFTHTLTVPFVRKKRVCRTC